MFEGAPKTPESANNNKAPIENVGEKSVELSVEEEREKREVLAEVIKEARGISKELIRLKEQSENKHDVVVDFREYKRVQKQQQRLRELFLGNPELTKGVCTKEKILYDPILDEMRKAANDNPSPVQVVS